MIIETEKFGSFDTKDSKIINFPCGLPGFEELKKFIILDVNETKPIYWLQSTENRHISLPVIITFELLSDYNINIREDDLEDLQFESKDDFLIMNVTVIPEDITKMTVNLAAPIIINAKHGIAKQIIIDAAELPIKYPIYEAIKKSIEGGGKDAGAIKENG